MAKGYTDKGAIQNYMLIDIDGSFDDQIDEWIEVAEDFIDHETNRTFGPYDTTLNPVASDRFYNGDGTKTLRIDPAIEVTEVRLADTDTPLDTDQYILWSREGTTEDIELRYLRFPKGSQNIYIKAKWGFNKVPSAVKQAATILVAGIIENAWQSEQEVQSVSTGRYTVTYKTFANLANFNPRVEDLLQTVRRYTF